MENGEVQGARSHPRQGLERAKANENRNTKTCQIWYDSVLLWADEYKNQHKSRSQPMARPRLLATYHVRTLTQLLAHILTRFLVQDTDVDQRPTTTGCAR